MMNCNYNPQLIFTHVDTTIIPNVSINVISHINTNTDLNTNAIVNVSTNVIVDTNIACIYLTLQSPCANKQVACDPLSVRIFNSKTL